MLYRQMNLSSTSQFHLPNRIFQSKYIHIQMATKSHMSSNTISLCSDYNCIGSLLKKNKKFSTNESMIFNLFRTLNAIRFWFSCVYIVLWEFTVFTVRVIHVKWNVKNGFQEKRTNVVDGNFSPIWNVCKTGLQQDYNKDYNKKIRCSIVIKSFRIIIKTLKKNKMIKIISIFNLSNFFNI